MNLRKQGFSRAMVAELTKLRQNLRRVVVDVERKVAPVALRAAAEVVQAAVVREAPVLSGFLSHQVEIVAAEEYGSTVLLVQIGEQDFVGKAFYAAMQEYGTERMPANAFMQRGLDSSRDEAVAAARSAFAKQMNRTFGA